MRKNSAAFKKQAMREVVYAGLCSACANFHQPTRKDIMGTIMWLHDDARACGAEQEREKNFIEDQKAKGEAIAKSKVVKR